MRDIDTDALKGVDESLGIGSPSSGGFTQLDDSVLQQVLDVGLVRRPRGIGVVYQRLVAVGSGTTARSCVSFQTVMDGIEDNIESAARLGLNRRNADLWLTGLTVSVDDVTELASTAYGVQLRDASGTFPTVATLFLGDAVLDTAPLISGGRQQVVNQVTDRTTIAYPIRLPPVPETLLCQRTVAAVGAGVTLTFSHHFWVSQRDSPLWYTPGASAPF